MAADSPLDPPHHIACWTTGVIRFVQLDRVARSNSYTQPMLSELQRQIDAADADASLRVLVITGAGERSFCAGADRDELKTRDWTAPLNLLAERVFRRIRQSRLVTIAAINGAAVGGGLELALACDFRIAAATARFWLPEPELGLIPAAGGTELLPMLVGITKAKELILAGAVWDAAEAFRIGLVSEVVPSGQLLPRAESWSERIVRRDGLALQLAKHALDLSAAGCRDTGYALLAQSLLVRQQRATEAAADE